jgi:hypothetical protein
MKVWQRDLLDHLVLLVLFNSDESPSEETVRDELKREFSPFLNSAYPARPAS